MNTDTTVYRIRDARGHLIAEHIRKDKPDGDKECFWRRPSGEWGLNGTSLAHLPLYGAEQLSTWPEDELIVLVEGEKARDALDRTDHFYALGTVTGAGFAPGQEALEVLRRRRVCLWPDNDEAGRAHMELVAERLQGIAAEVLVYEWPEAPKKGDAADHPAVLSGDRRSFDRLLTELESAPRWKPNEPPAVPRNGHLTAGGVPRRTLTDLGNAERFVDEHGQDARYCHPWGKFIVWDGKRWISDDAGEVERRMKATVRGIYAEAAGEESEKTRKALAEHAKRSEAAKRITDALRLVRSEPSIPIKPEQLDADPWLLNTENGTIDLRTGERREHRREDLITKLAPGEYGPEAQAPTFSAFLERILPSEALRRFVQRAIGYSAAGVVSEEVLVILHGTGANGKSTLVNAIMEALGDYAMQVAPDLLLAKRGSHPTELADLFGARLAAAVEVDQDRRLAESLVKQLTGRDRIKARRMREDFWEFDPTHTIFLATNHRPEVRGTDHAIWRRLKLVPFEVTIPEAEQDKRLAVKLRAERSGILAWIVRGCLEYQHEGLGEPEEVKVATEGYRVEMDVLAAFTEDRCVVHPRASAGATPLYNAYKDWCEESGETKLTQTKFGRRLKERGFRSEKAQRVTWYGIGLRDARPDPDGNLDSSEGHQSPPALRKGLDTGPTPLVLDSSKPNHLSGESGLDKGDPEDLAGESRQSRPEISMNSRNPPRESVIAKKGLELSNCLKLSNAGDATRREAERVRELLREPPAWLAEQMEKCQRDPRRFLNPTASAIAAELFGSPARWREVRRVLEAYVSCSEAGKED